MEQGKSSTKTLSPLDELHLAAIATSMGIVHLVDVYTGRIVRDLQIHSGQIKLVYLQQYSTYLLELIDVWSGEEAMF